MESVHYGVTSMRVHVEVDETVGLTCLNVGLRLKEELAKLCDIQITGEQPDSLLAMSTDLC